MFWSAYGLQVMGDFLGDLNMGPARVPVRKGDSHKFPGSSPTVGRARGFARKHNRREVVPVVIRPVRKLVTLRLPLTSFLSG